MMARYRFDPARSRFTVQAFATGLLSAIAHSPTFAVRSFDGTIRLEGSPVENLELELTVDADSLELENRVRPADRREIEGRMREEVLETSVYREITYRAAATRPKSIRLSRLTSRPCQAEKPDQPSGRRRMHELSIALSILDIAAEEAERHGGRVAAIHLKLGALSGVVKEALLSAYDLAREGTPLARAELVVEEVPVLAYCRACATERAPASVQELCCPACGAPTPDVIRGRELEVVALEIDS
jgi:hydrogenase nickel incorporation protein HypA/HybF